MTEPEFTSDSIRGFTQDLLDGWERDRGTGAGFSAKAHPAVVGTVYALTAHAHRLGHAVVALLDAGFTIEAIPSIRSAYEAAITASWVAQIPDALPAYMNRNHNQQVALRDTMTKAGWSSGKQPIPADEIEPYLVSKPSKEGASYVQKLCADFLANDGMYSIYRGLSWMTHPTAAVTDMYLWMGPDAQYPTLFLKPHVDKYDDLMISWVHTLCSSLVWSARALNFIDDKRASTGDRTRLRRAAKRLAIAEFLLVTPDAKFRGQQSERKRARRIKV